jgi:Zn-dependent membrane protease YugP
MDPMILLMMVGIPLISQMVASKLRKRFVEHSRDPMPMTGAEIAQRMLVENNINDVQVIPTQGQLTDHFNPTNKTVALSEAVFSQANVAACAVAAHECGHAVQHATGYPLLTLRTKMVPLLKLSNFALPVVGLGGAALFSYENNNTMAYLLLGLLALPTVFSLVTLPVEFDASRRALNWMETSGIAAGPNYAGARNALWWAAMTYVVAALGSIAQVAYFANRLLGHNRR